MSNRPGIGATLIPEVASVLLSLSVDMPIDVPTSLRIGPRVQPLGRYLTRQLRQHVGLPANAPQAVLDKMEEAMRPLREAASLAPKGTRKDAFRSLILDMNEGKYIQAVQRHRRKNPQGITRETLKI